MKSQDQATDEVLAIVYHLSKATQRWEQMDTGLLKFQDDIDEQGIVIGHSVVVTKILIPGTLEQSFEMPKIIIKSKLLPEKMYVREQGTIIYWNEIQLNQQIAVTFSDKKTCDKLWKRLCSFIGKNPFEVGILPPPDSVQTPHEDNLVKLLASVVEKQEAISYYIINKTKFLEDLLHVCRKILDQDKMELIQLMYKILRGIIQYNDTRIIQILFSSQTFPLVLNIYNKCLNPEVDYAEMLNERFHLINLIPLDQEIVEKIKLSHYIMFFKDVVLASMAQIPLQAALELSIKQCNMDIFNYITSENLMQQLRNKILSSDLPLTTNFFYQQLIFTKQFNDDTRNKLVQKYYSQGIVFALSQVLNNREEFKILKCQTQLRIIQVISKISQFNQKLFLEFLKTNQTLMESFAYYFHNGSEDIIDAISQIFRNLMLNNINKKGSLDLLTTGFFAIETRSIKQSNAKNQPWLKPAQKMIELITAAVESSQGIKVHKLLQLLQKNNLFQLFIQQPLTKIQKLKRLKLVNIIIFYNYQEMVPIQQSLIESRFFKTAILWLNQSHSKNNLIESTITNMLQKVYASEKFILMEQVQSVQNQLPQNKIITQIVNRLAQLRQQANTHQQRHRQILENQIQERYLNQQNEYQPQRKMSFSEPRQQMEESLKLLTQQLSKKDSFEDNLVRMPRGKKSAEFSFEFNTINEA